jgi:monoamine oxidase
VSDVDVAVVGGGFAGIAAARALAALGASAVVLEARDRVGGRVHTTHVDLPPSSGADAPRATKRATWADLGGQWLGPTQDRALALVRELGLETFPTWTSGDNLLLVGGERTRWRGTIPRLPIASLLNVGWAQWRLERMSKKVPLDAPWDAPKARAWDSVTLASFLDANVKTRTARALLDAALESVFAADAKDISLLHALFYIRSGKDLDVLLGTADGAQATRVAGGMQRFAEALAQGVEVRLSCPVRRIAQDATGVTVEAGEGTLRAKRCIVALPPKLVTEIAFDPALPKARADLVAKTPMGAVIKHTAVYERPFWRADGLSGMVVSDEGPIHVVFDNSPPEAATDGPGILMGFSEASSARSLGALEPGERRDAALRCFVRYHGGAAAMPIAYVDHVWEHDRWSGGCYGAFMPPGVWTALGPSLREPCGRVHWAGTETAAIWSGYIDGAIRSGERAAAEVAKALP